MFKRFLYGIVTFVVVCAVVIGLYSHFNKQDNTEASKEKVALTISAAASLKESLTEVQKVYEKQHPNVKLRFNFGASGALQQQIEKGAPVDLFFSAGKDKFAQLVNDGIILEDEYVDLVGNELVLVTPTNTESIVKKFEDLKKKDVMKISIGIPESVPAGQYAKESLENMNLWSSVEQKMVYAKDVRQVLSYVETGNIDAGIVYKTDALTSKKIEVVEEANKQTHQPILYPVGIIDHSKSRSEAKKFYLFLQGEKSKQIFEKYGFTSK
ncbi:molybdate ABC transporter substrate-binding protein [Gottfriedia solisilvae]|uniref:molybdate ABC transporter substrate-binding protein n=1 Tax=Gottfriedia solisilvae TaxID=1516104 RepID=UPI00157E23C5|nr:molybdate ABC transporter substrate-binding protein [Gottfriedia solisilvae]